MGENVMTEGTNAFIGMVLLLVGVFIILLGIGMTILLYWLCVKRPEYRKTHFTAETDGTVECMSNIYSCDIQVPLVRYTVNGTNYKVAGPRFAGSTVKTFNVAGAQLLKSDSNITADGELPLVVKMSGSTAAAQAAMKERYPSGTVVRVYYDPDKPKNAFVERDAPVSKTLTYILMGIMTGVTVIGIVMAVIGTGLLVG